jgi:hypothetical protein
MHAYMWSPIGGGFHFAVEDDGYMPEIEATANVQAPAEDATKASGIYLYISLEGDATVEGALEKMKEAGAVVTMPPKDLHYGARVGKIIDPHGVAWTFSKVVDSTKAAEESVKGAVSKSDNHAK